MVSRSAVAVAGLVASLGITAAVYYYTGQLLVLLVVPFVPLLLHRLRSNGKRPDTRRTCPTCGFTTDAEFAYCPHDGTRLE